MAMQPRETIYAALFALLQGLTSGGSPLFKTASRILPAVDQLQSEESPGVFTLQKSEEVTHVRQVPAILQLHVDVFIYATTQSVASLGGGNNPTPPASILNPLVDAVIGALVPVTQGQSTEQTLGGLVSKCRVAGKIEYGEGVTGNYAVAIIPIEMTVPQ